jgi:hypothetical protein
MSQQTNDLESARIPTRRSERGRCDTHGGNKTSRARRPAWRAGPNSRSRRLLSLCSFARVPARDRTDDATRWASRTAQITSLAPLIRRAARGSTQNGARKRPGSIGENGFGRSDRNAHRRSLWPGRLCRLPRWESREVQWSAPQGSDRPGVVVMVPWLCPERREPANGPVGRSDRRRCGPNGQSGSSRPGDAPRRPRRARASRGDEGKAVVRRKAQQGCGHVAHMRFGSARCLFQVRSSVDAQEGRTVNVLTRNMTLARRPSQDQMI